MAAIRRSLRSLSSYLTISKRLFSSITKPPPLPVLFRSIASLNRPGAVGLNLIRSCVNTSGVTNFTEQPPTDSEPFIPGYDLEHWLIVMHNPGGERATKKQMIDCYVQTLAKVLGSEEEAKKKIYSVSIYPYFGFGCEIDEETSEKLEELPGVLHVLPDSYVDAENKDYGGELYVNGEIVKRSPERQRRVEPLPVSRPFPKI
ncbi:hypothetical protein QVD17_10640 [Tagetes erecta]|uniref:MORF/ORRM1/DAG-like MORF domain-containing protein n=1 Tax=Tagetes erecta TaxID=13708 RepID=A0AAD8NZP4_TARER|nr:hypothetical protein QVD17_10640 [Tagetes erecta]